MSNIELNVEKEKTEQRDKRKDEWGDRPESVAWLAKLSYSTKQFDPEKKINEQELGGC